jgi:3-phenylpropionate/cinnamic acid dioxygenase small subunit
MGAAHAGRHGRAERLVVSGILSGGSNADPRDLLALATEFLQREVVYLDEQRWDDWLALLAPDVEYWMPAWKTEDALVEDPQSEVSHFYYASRAGVEDRILRIRSRRSPASTPLPRTTHLIGNVMLLESAAHDRLRLRSSWVCHVFFPRSKDSHAFFGHTEHTLARRDESWLIARKKIVLQNDYIPTMLDIYCV